METVVVTIEYPTGQCTDFALPLDVPIGTLERYIANAFNEAESWLSMSGLYDYGLRIKNTNILVNADETLASAGAVNGDILQVVITISGGPRLVSEEGCVFQLLKMETSIGRLKPPERKPDDIDVSKLKGAKLVSRLHAKILIAEEKFYVVDMDSTNGTYLNDQRIKENKPYEIQHGDWIWLAQSGVRLKFMIET